MSNKAEIPLKLRRRTHLVDRVIKNLLSNIYPCYYNSSDHFVEGVLDEIIWFLLDMKELQGIKRIDIENYILDYKYDELTDYFNEHCIVLKNDNLQEHIRKVLREEFDIPQPGESSGKPLSQDEMDFMDCDTDYLTIDEILDGRIQRIPYYKEVLEDVLIGDYSWGVTKKVVEYARYMKQNPKSLRNLPPIIVVDEVIQDGAHRISAIYLLQNHMDKDNSFWGEIELEVKFCYK